MLWWTYQQLRVSNLSARLAVVQKLAESGDESIEPLAFALKDKEAEVRVAAVRALGKSKSRRVVEPLIQSLQDAAPSVRATAAESLGQVGDSVAVNWLVALLRDADLSVRANASRSLEKLGWKPDNSAERVFQLLAKGNWRQVAALGTEAVEPLLEVMRSGAPDKQLAAVKTLGEIEDPRVVKGMFEALKKNSPALRIAALEVLERIGDPSAYENIERLFKDGNPNIRSAAVEAAVSCGGIRAIPALLNTLKDSSWEVRNVAVRALGSLEDAAAVEGLCSVLQDSDRDVREGAIVALGKICDRRVIPHLVLSLLDSESAVRSVAAASLRQIDRRWEKNESVRQVLPEIKAALNHHDYWIKHSAAKLFEQLGIDPDTVDRQPEPFKEVSRAESPVHPAFSILADLLFDFDRDLRLAAAEAFCRLREKNAQPILAAAVHDDDRFVQQAAQRALAALN